MVMLFLRRVDDRLMPADIEAAEAIGKMKHGEVVRADIRRTRNLKHHRKLFALLRVVFDAQPEPHEFLTKGDLLDALKIAVGHCTKSRHFGHDIVVPKSISWAAMDQATFEPFYDRIVDVILRHVLPHTERADLDREVYSILDNRNYMEERNA